MKKMIHNLCAPLLILLFVYAAASKLADFTQFRGELYNQSFAQGIADALVYLLPGSELLAAGLLLFPATRLYGLGLSVLLMAAFFGYTALVLLHFWPRVPCSCGGVLRHLSWRSHLLFNLFFLLAACCGWQAERYEGKPKTSGQSRHHGSN